MVIRVKAVVVQHDLSRPPDEALGFRAVIERYDYW
jgi:hypothetical protein